MVRGTQKIIILHSAPVFDWFEGQPENDAIVSLAKLCGSKNGVSFYQKEDIQTLAQWSTEQRQKVYDFLRINSFTLLDKAFEQSKGYTHVLFGFLGLHNQDVYANVPIGALYDYFIPQSVDANKEPWLTNIAPSHFLSSSSGLLLIPKILLQSPSNRTSQTAQKTDDFDLILAIDVDTFLHSLKQRALKRVRIFSQQRPESSVLYESNDPNAPALWRQEALAFEQLQYMQIPQKLKQQQIQSEQQLKTLGKSATIIKQDRGTFNALQRSPDFFKIAWLCGTISKIWIDTAQLERPLLTDGTYGALTDAQWNLVFKKALEKRLVSTQLFQKGVDARRCQYQKALTHYTYQVHIHTFIESIYPTPISKKMHHTLCAIYNAFFKDPLLLSSVKYLLQKGYNAQKLLGWSNLDTEEQLKAKRRLLALVHAVQSGADLQSAVDTIGPVFERSQFEALVHSRTLKGVPILLDDASQKTAIIAQQLGWKSEGKNVLLLRSYLPFSSPQDQELIIKAVQSGLSLQKELKNWTSGSPSERNHMRTVMNSFAADSTIFEQAVQHGEAYLIARKKHDQYLLGLAQKKFQDQSLSEHALPHVVALFRACESKEHADLLFNCVKQGLSVSKLYGIGKLTESKFQQVIALLEQFLIAPNDTHTKKNIIHQLYALNERPTIRIKRNKKVVKF